MGFQPNYQSEGRIYAKYILEHFPNGKIAMFWQNDDAGKDQYKGLRDGLGDKINMIIADKSYEVSDPSIDSQIVALHDSGADIFFSWAAPNGSAQAIRKVGELGRKPKFFLANTATSIASVLKPAGTEYAKGIISTAYIKDPTDPTWIDDPAVKKWRESPATCCCRGSRSTPHRTTTSRSRQMQLMRFNGEAWELFGDVITGEIGHDSGH